MNNDSRTKSIAKELVSYYSLLTDLHELSSPPSTSKSPKNVEARRRSECVCVSINYVLSNSDEASELLHVAYIPQPSGFVWTREEAENVRSGWSYKNMFNSFYCHPQPPILFVVLVDFHFSRKQEGITSSHSIPTQRIIFNGIWLTYDIPLRHSFVFVWKIVFVLDQIHSAHSLRLGKKELKQKL